MSRQHVTSEKITVSRKDATLIEETEKPRYPKDYNVGRIVIEEIPEEKNDVEKHEIVKRDEVKPRHEDMETCYNLDKVRGKQVREDLVKVGKLDFTDYEKTPRESKHGEERTATYATEFEEHRKVRYCTETEVRTKTIGIFKNYFKHEPLFFVRFTNFDPREIYFHIRCHTKMHGVNSM